MSTLTMANLRVSRRQFLTTSGVGLATAIAGPAAAARNAIEQSSRYTTRGIVLCPTDLSIEDWPERAAAAGLTTIAMHNGGCSVASIQQYIHSDGGQSFLRGCRKARLEVEYELHAMRELLPRALFTKAPEMFRVNENGQRTPDANCCVHSSDALDVVVKNALKVAKVLHPTTGRYFYWGDDGAKWCYCSKCKDLTGSDQALVVENAILSGLRAAEPNARLAHLAYHQTLEPPQNIKPQPGIFLEYAPIQRSWKHRYESRENDNSKSPIRLLDSNLKIFPADTAQVLEYWLDASKSSGYSRPAKKVFFDTEIFAADISAYGRRGIRHFTSFACWIDQEYLKSYGEPPLMEYGRRLRTYQSS